MLSICDVIVSQKTSMETTTSLFSVCLKDFIKRQTPIFFINLFVGLGLELKTRKIFIQGKVPYCLCICQLTPSLAIQKKLMFFKTTNKNWLTTGQAVVYHKDTEPLCTHLYHFFPVFIHYLQYIHCFISRFWTH